MKDWSEEDRGEEDGYTGGTLKHRRMGLGHLLVGNTHTRTLGRLGIIDYYCRERWRGEGGMDWEVGTN